MNPSPRDSSRPCPEDGILAAFAEGQLNGAERAEALEHMATCPRCTELLADLARFETEQADQGRVLPFRPRAILRFALPLAAAATLVLFLRGRAPVPGTSSAPGPGRGSTLASGSERHDPIALLTRGDRLHALPAAAWAESSTSYGFSPRDGATSRAFMAGVHGLDLDLARLADDEAAAVRAQSRLTALDFDAAQPPTGPGQEPDPDWHAFGRWTEAGRLAAASANLDMLRGGALGEALSAASRLPLSEPARKELDALRARLARSQGPPPDLAAVEGSFAQLIRLLHP